MTRCMSTYKRHVGSQITLHLLGQFNWLFTADSHASAPSLFSKVTALPNRTDGGSRPEASVPGFSPGYGRNCRDIAEADDQPTDVGVVGLRRHSRRPTRTISA